MEDWRRIDIDALDPDSQITKEDLIPQDSITSISSEEVQQQISSLRSLIGKGAYSDAISFVTSNPPYGADLKSKELFINQTLELLSAIKQTEISSIVSTLDFEQQNVLIKYIYKGFSLKKGQQHGGVLLSWFDKTVAITGIGPVVRYLSDRRTI